MSRMNEMNVLIHEGTITLCNAVCSGLETWPDCGVISLILLIMMITLSSKQEG